MFKINASPYKLNSGLDREVRCQKSEKTCAQAGKGQQDPAMRPTDPPSVFCLLKKRARQDSNLRPTDSKSGALSS